MFLFVFLIKLQTLGTTFESFMSRLHVGNFGISTATEEAGLSALQSVTAKSARNSQNTVRSRYATFKTLKYNELYSVLHLRAAIKDN